jgi:hypothetical protein
VGLARPHNKSSFVFISLWRIMMCDGLSRLWISPLRPGLPAFGLFLLTVFLSFLFVAVSFLMSPSGLTRGQLLDLLDIGGFPRVLDLFGVSRGLLQQGVVSARH